MFRRKRPATEPAAGGVVLGVLASHDDVVVAPDGSVRPGGASLALEWIVGAAEEWHRGGGTRVSQRLVDGLPVVETSVRVPGGQIIESVWCVADGGAELAVLEIDNRSKEAVSVALAVTSARATDGVRARSDGLRLTATDAERSASAVFGRRPARLVHSDRSVGMADSGDVQSPPFELNHGFAHIWPLAHTASLRVAVVLEGEWDGSPDALPDAEAVARGWRTHVDAGARLELPDPGLAASVVTARAALLIRGSRPRSATEAAAVAAALGAWGHHDAALAPIEVLLDGQRYDGSFDKARPEATALALAAWGSHVRAPGDGAAVAERLAEPAAKAAHRLSKVAFKSAPPAWFAVAQHDAAALLDRADQADAADLCRTRVTPTAAEPAGVPAGDVGGADLVADARFLLDIHRFLVDDTVPGVLTLVPAWPDTWLGAGLEAHRLPTRAGLLSFAVRWHGARPAVLWELDADGPVELRTGLDPTWAAGEPVGEALLAPVEPAGGLPGVVAPLGGAQTPVDEAPDDGVSFR